MAAKKKQTTGDHLMQGAIRQCVLEALRGRPVEINMVEGKIGGFLIDGAVYTEDAAVEKILKKYSWYTGSTT